MSEGMGKDEHIQKEKISREMLFQIVIISIMNVGSSIFFSFEGTVFNSYVRFVLDHTYFYVAIMVSLSATMGLIFWFVFGIISDNTRSKWGRRRPYMLLGPVAGVSMILFAFSPNFYWCLFFDVVIIGIFANAHLAAEESVLPDVVDKQYRGRANAIKGFLMIVGGLVPNVLLLYVYDAYTVPHATEGRAITYEGHFLLILIGGLIFIISCLIGFFFIREPDIESMPPKKSFKEELLELFRIEEFQANKDFFIFLLAFFLFNVGTKIFGVYSFFYVLKLDLELLLLVLALITLGPLAIGFGFLGGFLADKKGRKKLVIPLFLIASIGYIMMPMAGTGADLNINILIIGLIFALLGSGAIGAPLQAWRQDLLPDDKRGQYTGIMNITGTLNQIPAAIIAALVADSFGVEFTMWIIPFFLLGSIPIFMKVKETLPVDLPKDKIVIEEEKNHSGLGQD